MATIIANHGTTTSPAPEDVVQFPGELVTLEGDTETKADKFTYRTKNGKLAFLVGVARLYPGLGNTYRVTEEPVVVTPTPDPTPQPDPQYQPPTPGKFAWGVNLPNASNGSGVGTINKEWSIQPVRDFREVYGAGGRLFRLGYRTTRIMPSRVDTADDGTKTTVGLWDQPLIADVVTKIRANIQAVIDLGPDSIAIPEMHDYGRAFGVQLGVAPFDVDWIVWFWKELLGPELMGHPRVFIDINNEPHLSKVWHQTVVDLVPALRAAGVTNYLVLEGLEYSGTRGWASKNGEWFLSLFANDKKLIASPHLYVDNGGNGDDNSCASGSANFADSFIAWVKANNVPSLIGEFGYSTSSSCKDVMPVLMEKFKEAGIWVTAWNYSLYMPTEKYHFGMARPAQYAMEPSNLFKSFAAISKA